MKRAKPSKPGTFARLIEETAIISGESIPCVRRVVETFATRVSIAAWDFGRISIPGLATFRVRERKARVVRNPDTDMSMVVPAHRVVTALVAKSWRRR